MLDSFHLQRLHGNLTQRVQVNRSATEQFQFSSFVCFLRRRKCKIMLDTYKFHKHQNEIVQWMKMVKWIIDIL